MKKTYNINIAGYGFVIDEDAYVVLDSYLSTLGEICTKAGERETAIDIEQRIAEIFSEKFEAFGAGIISKGDVEDVISRMGAPEEIVDIETETTAAGPETNRQVPPPFAQGASITKRLYRDTSNRVLGGVCSGLAWYLGIDPVWVRIVAVILAFISGSTLALIYIILWIIIPPARTPYERMQMMGVNPSIQNVGRVVTGRYDRMQNGAAPGGCQNSQYVSSDTAARVGKVIMMILTVIALLIVGALLLALSIAFIGCIVAVCVTPPQPSVKLVLGCIIGGSLVVGIPLFILFRNLAGALTDRRPESLRPSQQAFLWVFWGLGVAAAVACGILLGHIS